MAERRLRFRKNEPSPGEKKEAQPTEPGEHIYEDVRWKAELSTAGHGYRILFADGDIGEIFDIRFLEKDRAKRIVQAHNRTIDRIKGAVRQSNESAKKSDPDVIPSAAPSSLRTSLASFANRNAPTSYDPATEEWASPMSDYDFVDVISRRGSVILSGVTPREARNIVNEHNAALARVIASRPPSPEEIQAAETRRSGTCLSTNVNVNNEVRDIAHLGAQTQRIVVSSNVRIELSGSGDPIAILEQAIQQIRNHGDQVRYTVNNSVR